MARDTAGVVVALLNLRQEIAQRENVVAALKAGQLPDGGWGQKQQEGSDLATTYEVMWALARLEEKPDTAAVRSFVAKCRNADGSYSLQPRQPGNVSATYYASVILRALDHMKEPA